MTYEFRIVTNFKLSEQRLKIDKITTDKMQRETKPSYTNEQNVIKLAE